MMIDIREETIDDLAGIRAVNMKAFGQSEEGDIVDALRAADADLLSLVAVSDGQVVGHIAFSRATIDSAGRTIVGMGLAPMAVLPEFQKQGIGSRLVNRGLDMLKATACPFVIVLGHAEYYPRFGFEIAATRKIQPQWPGVPDEAFMVLVLDETAMDGVSGVARYRDEFDAAM